MLAWRLVLSTDIAFMMISLSPGGSVGLTLGRRLGSALHVLVHHRHVIAAV